MRFPESCLPATCAILTGLAVSGPAQPVASSASLDPTCPADTNGDQSVDLSDLTTVLLQWGMTGCDRAGDVDGSCAVDVEDLVAIIVEWGWCQCSSCNVEGDPEGEACGVDENGGCGSVPPVFGALDQGQVVCGAAWADGFERDTDWFLYDHDGGLLQATLTSEFDGLVLVVDGMADCSMVVVGAPGWSTDCGPGSPAFAELPPGVYGIFVATADFDGLPCGTTNGYTVTASSGGPLPTGACCFPTSCAEGLSPFACADAGGTFQGADTSCVDAPCPVVCGEDAGPCDEANGTPGCADVDCCGLICAEDPFCCDVEWDQICADAAIGACDLGAGIPGAHREPEREQIGPLLDAETRARSCHHAKVGQC